MAEEGAFWNNWKNQALPASGSTISNTQGGYAGYKGGTTTSTSADPFAIELLNAPASAIKATADLLVAAGYLKTTTSKSAISLICAGEELISSTAKGSVATLVVPPLKPA